MPILDAALAFSLTMLVVASAVTLIVETLKNTAQARRNTLKKMLNKFYEKECLPVLDHEAERLAKEVDEKVGEAIKTIKNDKDYDMQSILDKVEAHQLSWLSTQDLVEYLKRTSLGTTLLTQLGDRADEVFDKLGKRYEAIGARFTESFRKNSRQWTTIVALVVALVLISTASTF